MLKRVFSTLILFSFFTVWMISCEKENDSNISFHNSDESHNTGDNCMNCHYQAGPGDGWFSVAGSVYGDYENHSVRVFDAKTQELLAKIEIDQLGNLYTSEEIDFSNGITIGIINEDDPNEAPRVMGSVVETAQCNLCHNDKQQAKIIL